MRRSSIEVINYAVYHWTYSAIQCYRNGCNCDNCELIKGLETVNKYNCQMKKAVFALIKKLGMPPEIVDEKGVIDYE